MKKSDVQELYNELKFPEISMNDINLNGVIVSKIGRHAGDSLRNTLRKKTKDLKNMEKRYGEESYCIWSHGNLNPDNTHNFCDKISDNGERKVYVFMP